MGWTPESLVRSVDSVSSLPTVFTRINEAVNNPKSSNKDISDIIEEDAGLTARLLHIANSAFFSFPKKIDTIGRAVTIIGTQQLRDLALATSVLAMFSGIPKELVDMEQFWKHSIATGIAARILATYRREPNVERFFVTGLLHDLGRLIFFMKLPDEISAAITRARNDKELLYKVEKEVFGFHHGDVGGALLSGWQLPDSICEAVLYHHSPRRAKRFPLDASIIHIADIIVNAFQFGSSGEVFVPAMQTEAWEQLGQTDSILPPAIQQLDRQFKDAVSIILPDAA